MKVAEMSRADLYRKVRMDALAETDKKSAEAMDVFLFGNHREGVEMSAKWIDFKEVAPAPKTQRWDVYTKRVRFELLGQVRWYGPWRKYSFFPAANCVFERDCLRDISDFLDTQNHQRKVKGENHG